jgi:hypothetical protein
MRHFAGKLALAPAVSMHACTLLLQANQSTWRNIFSLAAVPGIRKFKTEQ